MRCSSYCTAEEYTLNQETISILEKTTINPEFIEKVLHYQLANEHDSHPIDVFLFTFGCIIHIFKNLHNIQYALHLNYPTLDSGHMG